jgi:hypothetical protein
VVELRLVTLPRMDAEFWQTEAARNHEWSMLMYRFRKELRRTCRDGHDRFDRLRELDRAHAMLMAQYFVACACRELAIEGFEFDELIRVMLDEFEHRQINL